MTNLTCPFCFQKGVFYLRFDRNRRPFWACDLCKMKIFTTSGLAIGSVSFWCKTLEGCNGEALKQASEQARSFIRSNAGIYGQVSESDLYKEKLPVRETALLGEKNQ